MASPTFGASLAERLARRTQADRWRADPVAWVNERLGEFVWSGQARIMRSVATDPLVAVQSCHGSGKSHLAARLIAWYISVYPPGQVFAVTTAPTSAQVRAILWRYIRQVHGRAGLAGDVMQTAEWKIDGELVAMGRKPNSYDDAAFQGLHAPVGVLVVIDEASGVDEQLWVAADSLATTPASRILAIGNPDVPGSHFHRVCTTERGWTRHTISAFDTPAFTGEQVPEAVANALVSREWVDDKRLRWGEQNPLYRAKVCAEFADSDDGLIPLSWVRAANARWHTWNDAGAREVGGRRIIGVDVARYGEDATCLAIREGDVIRRIDTHHKLDTTQTTALVEAELDFPRSVAIVDVIGVGAGVVDQLRSRHRNVVAFNAAQATRRRDSTGSWKFNSSRSAAWWNLRELLDPAAGATLALPEDDELTAELCAPRWQIGTGNTLRVESKDDIRKRIGRSTDRADAVIQALWHNPSSGRIDRDDDGERVPRQRPKAIAYADAPMWN